MTSTSSHYERLGGREVIVALVERFYEHMDSLPAAAVIRALHPADLTQVKRVLANYLTEWTGGPDLYSRERGHPRLRQRHFGFVIGPDERDAWMACMQAALGELVGDVVLRDELALKLGKLAEFLRNDSQHRAGHGA